jgi:hypothetical protein
MLPVSFVHCTSSGTFTATAIDCVQALLPFVIGLDEYASSGRNPALWFVWQLPSSTEEQRTAHAKLTALCHSEVVPRTITARQEKQLAALCRNPVLQLSKATVKFLLREVFGMGACGSSEKEKRIKALFDDPQTADELADFGCNQTVRKSAWQCWPLFSICSGHGVVPPQRKCRGTSAAAKRRVVGMKRKHKPSSARGGAWGRGASSGGRGRSLGRGVPQL